MRKLYIICLILFLGIAGCSKNNEKDIINSSANGETLKNDQEEADSLLEESPSIERNIISFDNENPEGKLGEYVKPEPVEAKNLGTIIIDGVTQEFNVITKDEDSVYDYEDVMVYNNQIMACNVTNSCIDILNDQLEIVDTIGSFGSDAMQYINPLFIDQDDNGNVYIMDFGNERIQVLNSELAYEKEIELPLLKDISYAKGRLDMIVDKEGEYAYFSSNFPNVALYVIDLQTGEYYSILDYTTGFFAKSDNGEIFYIESDEYYEDGEHKGCRSGTNYMYTISKDKIVDKIRLVDCLNVRAVMSYGDNLMFGSYQAMTFDGGVILEYSKKGEFIQTPFGIAGEVEKPEAENYQFYISSMAQKDDDTMVVVYAKKIFGQGNLAIIGK
ncbi:MAG TPA: hypothetical protein DCE48_17100 [Lachnospiraceae bacterium]|uniref:hypothetical protein n=1 Tax=Anaerosporobacter sp. TaxID=1872529 RepID=UPI000EE0AB08|nr:hypothetical protein [Anaerosporobacter sp.]HAB62382.1 hypothetical protein [Lachnospiraceae bacterium]